MNIEMGKTSTRTNYFGMIYALGLDRGVTAVRFQDYAIGCLGFIPGTVAYVFIGTTASNLLDDDDEAEDDDGGDSTVQLIVIIVGAIATVIAVVMISIYSKRALNKVLEEDHGEGEEAEDADAIPPEVDTEAQQGVRPIAMEHAVRIPRV